MKKALTICTSVALAIILTIVFGSVFSSKTVTADTAEYTQATSTTTAPSNQTASRDWIYYRKFTSKYKIDRSATGGRRMTQEESGILNERQADSRYVKIFEQVKKHMRSNLAEYTGLDWERFNAVELVECDEKYSNVTAIYDLPTNKVFFARENSLEELVELKKVFAHELFHSLYTMEDSSYVLNYYEEGFTEYIAQMLYPDAKDLIYLHGVIIAKALVGKYGIQGVIDLIHDADGFSDKMSDLIGKPYSAEYLAVAANIVSASPDVGEKIVSELAIIDCLCHLTVNLDADKEEVASLYNEVEDANPDSPLVRAVDYFNTVLNR